MKLESRFTKYADERVNYYMGLAGRIGFAVTSVGSMLLAGWFVFEGLALGSADGIRNALLVAAPPLLGMVAFTVLQVRWHAFVWSAREGASES